MLSIGQLLCVGKTIEGIFLVFLWNNLFLTGPVWAPRLFRIVHGPKQLIRRITEVFMRGYGPQIAALSREVAGLRNRLSFLWNTERVRRAGIRQEGGFVPSSPQPAPAAGSAILAHPTGQFSFVFVLVAGSIFGGLVTAGSICLGVWISNLIHAGS